MPEAITTPQQAADSATPVPDSSPTATPAPTPESPDPSTVSSTPDNNGSDILSRVNQIKTESSTPTQSQDEDIFSTVDFDRGKFTELVEQTKSINPELAAQLEAMPRSWQSGVTKKFQEAAELKRQAEAQLNQSNQPWTPERINQLLQDQSFVQAAQSVVQPSNQSGGQLSDEEWSTLSDSEKTQFNAMQDQLRNLTYQLTSMHTQQEDTVLKERYGDYYNAQAITQLQSDLITGRVRATREHLHKVQDYEAAIQRAYKLGQEDARSGITQSAEASSPDAATVTTAYTPPIKEATTTGPAHFVELAKARLQSMKNGSARAL